VGIPADADQHSWNGIFAEPAAVGWIVVACPVVVEARFAVELAGGIPQGIGERARGSRFFGGHDFYAYVLNNPLRYRDPFGRQGEVSDCFPDCVHSPQERAQLQREHDQMMQQILGQDQGPSKPPPPSTSCNHNPDHECAAAYWETATGGVLIVGWLAVDLYLLPEALAESGLEGTMVAFGHGGATIPIAVGVVGYVDGIENISRHCPLIIDWFLGN